MAPGRNRTQATSVEGGALTTAPSLLPQMSIKMVQKHFSFVFVSIFPRPGQCCDSRFTSNAKMCAKSNSLVTQDKQARLVVLHLPARWQTETLWRQVFLQQKMCQAQHFWEKRKVSLLFTPLHLTNSQEYFFRVYIASSKHERGLENSRQICKPEMWVRICITFENSPKPRGV